MSDESPRDGANLESGSYNPLASLCVSSTAGEGDKHSEPGEGLRGSHVTHDRNRQSPGAISYVLCPQNFMSDQLCIMSLELRRFGLSRVVLARVGDRSA